MTLGCAIAIVFVLFLVSHLIMSILYESNTLVDYYKATILAVPTHVLGENTWFGKHYLFVLYSFIIITFATNVVMLCWLGVWWFYAMMAGFTLTFLKVRKVMNFMTNRC